MQYEIVICQCENVEHQILFSYIDNMVFMQIYLKPEKNILKRIWIAILYIFNYRSNGHFDEIILKKEDSSKFYNIAKYLEDA
jgi:hypothetical protein